jgi:AraC-like DNA-binding protein
MIDPNEYAFWPIEASFGEVMYPPGSTYGPRIQFSYQLVLLYRGTMTVWVNGQPRNAQPGSIALLCPGHEERFVFALHEPTYHSWVHIQLPTLSEELRLRLAELPRILPLSTPMEELMRTALSLRVGSLSTQQQLLKSMACTMLWRYMGEGEQLRCSERHKLEHPALERARTLIEVRLGDHLTLTEIAAAVALSAPQLIRLFRTQVGLTPMAYLWSRRITRGLELLRDTGLPISEIALRCGFQTSYHFSRRIREAVGMSPTMVRQHAWSVHPEALAPVNAE